MQFQSIEDKFSFLRLIVSYSIACRGGPWSFAFLLVKAITNILYQNFVYFFNFPLLFMSNKNYWASISVLEVFTFSWKDIKGKLLLKGGRNWLKLSIPQLWLESLFACLDKYEKQLSQTTICLCVCNFCSGMPSKGYFFHSSWLRVFDCFQALLQWVNDLNQRGEIIFLVFYDHRGVFLRLELRIGLP